MTGLPAQPPVDKSAPVLVIDDHFLMEDLTTRTMRQIGLENIDQAKDGMTALLMMARRNYALVICDLVMEPVSDVNHLKTVRADEVLRKTKFLIMTAHGSSEDVVQARAAGVDSFIVKSFTPEALKAKIIDPALIVLIMRRSGQVCGGSSF